MEAGDKHLRQEASEPAGAILPPLVRCPQLPAFNFPPSRLVVRMEAFLQIRVATIQQPGLARKQSSPHSRAPPPRTQGEYRSEHPPYPPRARRHLPTRPPSPTRSNPPELPLELVVHLRPPQPAVARLKRPPPPPWKRLPHPVDMAWPAPLLLLTPPCRLPPRVCPPPPSVRTGPLVHHPVSRGFRS